MLGFIGLVIPIVPQIPFFLLGVFFMSKGSPKFEKKIKSTALYKKYLSKVADKKNIERAVGLLIRIIIILCLCIAVLTGVWALINWL